MRLNLDQDADALYDEWIESLSDERIQMINVRMNAQLEPEEWDDEDRKDEVFRDITTTMLAADILNQMESEGLVKKIGVDEFGCVQYGVVNEDEETT